MLDVFVVNTFLLNQLLIYVCFVSALGQPTISTPLFAPTLAQSIALINLF